MYIKKHDLCTIVCTLYFCIMTYRCIIPMYTVQKSETFLDAFWNESFAKTLSMLVSMDWFKEIYRKPLFLPSDIEVSCKLSRHPIL